MIGNAPAKQIIIRLGHIDPVTHPHNLACEKLVKLVKERTNGEIEIQVYPAAQLGKAPNLMEQLQLGTIQMFQGGVAWWGSSNPDYYLVSGNFVFDNPEHCMAVMTGEIGERLSDKLYEKTGVIVLSQGLYRHPRNLLSTRPIRSLEDLKGLKVRVPPMANWMLLWKGIGANPTPMPLTETYLGLQQGVVDGVEHGLPQLLLNNYTEVAKYCTLTRHQFETAGFYLHEKFFSSLSKNHQKVISEAVKEVVKWNNEIQPEYLEQAKKKMKAQNVKFIDIDNTPWYKLGRKITKDVLVPEVKYTPGLVEEIWAFKDY
jgi:tripartite ATP-independent transporter DctP family solute receptor